MKLYPFLDEIWPSYKKVASLSWKNCTLLFSNHLIEGSCKVEKETASHQFLDLSSLGGCMQVLQEA